jgi:hypothetical protein
MAGLTLGIIALVLGVPALVVSWVPMFCLVGLITAGIGLLAGTIGIALAVMQKGEGLGVSIVGGAVNLLALSVALLMTFVSGALIANLDKTPKSGGGKATETSHPAAGPDAKDVPPAGSQPEEGGARLPGWGQKVDPDNDCTFEVQGAGLDVTVPPTPHDLSVELARTNAPRVLQEVVGDFTLRVKVCGVLRPTAPGSVEGRLPYQAAGVLVWSNEDNYLRLERAGLNRNGNLSSYVAFELRTNGLQGARRILSAFRTRIPISVWSAAAISSAPSSAATARSGNRHKISMWPSPPRSMSASPSSMPRGSNSRCASKSSNSRNPKNLFPKPLSPEAGERGVLFWPRCLNAIARTAISRRS